MLGSIFYGIETMHSERTRAHHPEYLMRSMLIGVGVEPTEAQTTAFMPLPTHGAVEGPNFSTMRPVKRPSRQVLRHGGPTN